LKWSLGGPLSKLFVTPPFSINFRCQIENQLNNCRLLGASSLLSFRFKFWYKIYLNQFVAIKYFCTNGKEGSTIHHSFYMDRFVCEIDLRIILKHYFDSGYFTTHEGNNTICLPPIPPFFALVPCLSVHFSLIYHLVLVISIIKSKQWKWITNIEIDP
jgi:hypothetical protein